MAQLQVFAEVVLATLGPSGFAAKQAKHASFLWYVVISQLVPAAWAAQLWSSGLSCLDDAKIGMS